MKRIARNWGFCMLGGWLAPALSTGQEAKPAEPARVEASPTRDAPPGASKPKKIEELVSKLADAKARVELQKLRATGLPALTGTRSTFRVLSFDVLESDYGLNLAPVDDALRAQLELGEGQGAVIVGVKPESLAEQAGLKPNDLLLELGGKEVRDVEQARSTFLGLGKGAVEVKLIREGKPSRLSLVGPGHGFPPGSSEYWIGVPVSPVDPTLRSHLADLPAGAGLVVNDVVKDSPADKAGVKKSDILVSMGGKPLGSSDSLIERVQASAGKPVPLVLFRAGKSSTVEVTPTRRAHPTVVSLAGRDGVVRQIRNVWPNFAIEFDPKTGKPTGGGNDLPRLWNLGGSNIITYRADQAGPNARTDAIIVNPYRVEGAPLGEPDRAAAPFEFRRDPAQNPNLPGVPNDIQLRLYTNSGTEPADGATARIEAQLKELSAKVDEVRKAVEGLKKAEVK